MSRWPDVVPLLATRCLYKGYIWSRYVWLNVRLTWHLTINVKLTWWSSTLGHQMPLLGGTSEPGMSDVHLPPQLSYCTQMYVGQSLYSCCCFSCVILLLLQQCNYRVTTQTTTRTTTTKRSVIDYWTENVCRLNIFFLFWFFMCNFVVVATTQLCNNNNNKNNNSQKI